MCNNTLLEVKGLSASFAKKRLLNNVCFSVCAGEVHAIIGCNGSGKTLFGKCISGIVKPASGTISFNGKENVVFKSPVDAVSQGIFFCMQDLNLLDNQTIADNLYAGSYSGIIINRNKIYLSTKAILDRLRISADPFQLVETLSLADKYLLQLGRCLINNPKLVILDEITAALTKSESEVVFDLVKEFRKNGVAVIYISHNINDVLLLADRVTVLKDGEVVDYFQSDELQDRTLIQAMLGKDNSEPYPKLNIRHGETILEVSHIESQYIHDFSFSLHEGEIIGIAGISGSGRTKLMQTIVGIEKIETGDIIYSFFESKNSKALPSHFVGYIPEDKDRFALFDTFSSVKNVTVRTLKHYSNSHIIKLRKEGKEATDLITRLGIKDSGPYDKIKTMSNGNKQKLVMSQCLYSKCLVYLFDEPTQNIDIASKVEIYNIMNELAMNGAGIVMVSSDFSELTNMCDRILVIKKGTLVANVPASAVTPESILSDYLI